MELNNALAVIDLKGYFVPHISIDNDFRIISRENYTVSMKIENGITDINEIQRNETTGHLEAHLILDLTVTAVSNDDNSKKCKINIVLSGLFDYSGEDRNEFYYMLLINGNSTLYSIARSHIITLTALSNSSGQIVIPMVNFVKLLEDSKKDNQ